MSFYKNIFSIIGLIYLVFCSAAYAADVPRGSWSVHFVDSEETQAENGVAGNVFDGDINTLWQTQYSNGSSPGHPHDLQINLGSSYDLDAFRYRPRQNWGGWSRVRQYQFYVSTDGVNWGGPVASGNFSNGKSEKRITFASKTGQYIRFVTLSEQRGNETASVAELNIEGNPSSGGGNQAPDSVIDSPLSNVTINVGDSVNFGGTGTDPNPANTPFSYFWDFGGGATNSTVRNPGQVQFNIAGTYNITFTVTDSLGLADPSPAQRTITVNGGSGNCGSGNGSSGILSQSGWSVHFVDSEETQAENGVAGNVFDGDINTLWQTQYSNGSSPGHPHDLQINLGSSYDLDAFRYRPRQNFGGWSRVRQYQFYVSADGVNWGGPVASGNFSNGKSEKRITFASKTGQYIRFVTLSEQRGNETASVAELNVEGQEITCSDADYVAFGDSITFGLGDDIPGDGIGYPPILDNLLAGESVANEGISGLTLPGGVSALPSVINQNPDAQFYLIQLGTNGSGGMFPLMSGYLLDSNHPNYPGTYKDYMQQMVTIVKNSGTNREAYLAKVPYTLETNTGRNARIQEFNQVVEELVMLNSISVTPPDFYTFFQNNQNLFIDNFHFNGVGYQEMADLWFQALP